MRHACLFLYQFTNKRLFNKYFDVFNIFLSSYKIGIHFIFANKQNKLFSKRLQYFGHNSGFSFTDFFGINNSQFTFCQSGAQESFQGNNFFFVRNCKRKISGLRSETFSSFISTRSTFISLSCSSCSFLCKWFFSTSCSLSQKLIKKIILSYFLYLA